MARGGYREPSHPAPVSGPGALSQRTDGGPGDGQAARDLPDAKYGEGKEFREAQQAAPMAERPAGPRPQPVPLDADTAYPDEPVTAGAPVGDGIGPDAAGIGLEKQDFNAMKPLIPGLEVIADLPGSNPSTRAFVRYLRSLG